MGRLRLDGLIRSSSRLYAGRDWRRGSTPDAIPPRRRDVRRLSDGFAVAFSRVHRPERPFATIFASLLPAGSADSSKARGTASPIPANPTAFGKEPPALSPPPRLPGMKPAFNGMEPGLPSAEPERACLPTDPCDAGFSRNRTRTRP